MRALIKGNTRFTWLWPLRRLSRRVPTAAAAGTMERRTVLSPRPPGILRRFRRDRRGVAAIEFALLAPSFLLVLTSIFDISWMFLQQTLLETALQAATREIRTGQVTFYYSHQATPPSAADMASYFQSRLCANLLLAPCSTLAYQVVDLGTNFATATLPSPIVCSAAFDTSGRVRASFTPPMARTAGSSIVYVNVIREYQFMTPMLARLWSRSSNCVPNAMMLSSTTIFVNEPFPWSWGVWP